MNQNKARFRSAVALSYSDDSQNAPKVCARGEELSADEIVQIARRYSIPIQEDPYLAQALKGLELDSEIPPELFRAVALILQNLTLETNKKIKS